MAKSDKPQPPRHYAAIAWNAPDFLDRDIPERTWLIEGAIAHPTTGMLYAFRGSGKSWTALQLALAVASGERWMAFNVPKARGVLYVDGEMALCDLRDRIRGLTGGHAPSNLWILASEDLASERMNLNLALREDQQAFARTLLEIERRAGVPIEFVILDNWISLVRGLDENDNSALDGIRQWLIMLRHGERSVLVVHHAGKTGQQRGASAREDNLDYSIKLQQTMSRSNEAWFEVEWDKCRGARPVPDRFTLRLATDEAGRLQLRPVPQAA